MATVVHGACNSPRQQHQCELATGAGGCLSVSHHQHQHPHQHQHQHQLQQATPIYSSVTKYLRSGAAPQLHSHPHIYDGNGGSTNVAQLQYGGPLNQQMSYVPMVGQGATHTSPPLQHAYCSAATPVVPAIGEPYRNYYGNAHALTMTYGGGVSGNGRHSTKRKTAVQLLAETKPFYMKGETGGMVDRLQATASPTPSYRKNFLQPGGLKRGRNSATPNVGNQVKYGSGYSSGDVERRYLPRPPTTTRETNTVHGGVHAHHHHHNHHSQMGRHSTPAYNNNMMQSKLKLLLVPETGRERTSLGQHTSELQRKFELAAPVGEANCSVESPMSYLHKEDVMAIPPPMFLSSQTFDESYNYAVRENSSIDEPLVLTDDYRPISPPAEYAAETSHGNVEARGRYNYQRSYSHSHEMSGEHGKYDVNAFNINSHKSLPDLHSQISRHSPHSEILSCCSRGNRSIKSTGESSLNRDSGGSSGHYTHRSEPCYRQREPERETYDAAKTVCCNHAEYRRDSGSSTQHSANSYCGYASPTSYGRAAAECAVCRCNRNSVPYDSACDYLLNFPTPVVPEAFQDDYTPPSPSVAPPQTVQQSTNRMKLSEPRYYSSSSIDYRSTTQGHYNQTPSNVHPNMRIPPNSCAAASAVAVQSPGSTPSIEDISPPPIQFKRQKCIRLKNRGGRLPVPNPPMPTMCTSVNGNTALVAYNQHEPQQFLFPKCIAANSDEYNRLKPYGGNSRRSSCERVIALPLVAAIPQTTAAIAGTGSELDQSYQQQQHIRENDIVTDLEHFFDRLGLNDKKYHEIYAPPRRRRSTTNDSDDSSTVFFSDVSTVDSMRLPDSTETQPQTAQPYRPSEPPSIVERNARIIKWLCNIKKLEHN